GNGLPAGEQAHDQGDHEDREEDVEQSHRNSGGGAGDAPESEERRNQRQNEKRERPSQHRNLRADDWARRFPARSLLTSSGRLHQTTPATLNDERRDVPLHGNARLRLGELFLLPTRPTVDIRSNGALPLRGDGRPCLEDTAP